MKVLHITHAVAGGVVSYLEEVIPFQQGVLGPANVALVAPREISDKLELVAPASLIGARSSTRSVRSLLEFTIDAWRAIRRWNPDVMHVHSTYAGVAVRFPLFFIPRRARPMIVYCSHGWAFDMQVSRFKKELYAAVERTLSRVTDRIINISHHEMRAARSWKLPSARMAVVHNGIADTGAPDGGASKERTGPLRLLFIGRLDPQKGADLLVEAVESSPELGVSLTIIGEPTRGERPSSADARITYLGWLSRQALRTMLREADALVVPSRWEGFGLVAIEGLREGVPVLASDAGGLPEIVRHGENGYVFPRNDMAGLKTLLASLTRPALSSLRTCARQTFVDNFTSHRMNVAILDEYARLRSGKESGRAIRTDGQSTPQAVRSTGPR